MTRKEAATTFYHKHPILVIYGIILGFFALILFSPLGDLITAGTIGMLYYTTEPEITQYWLTDEQTEQCGSDILKLEKSIYDVGELDALGLTEFNRLVDECNLSLLATQYSVPIPEREILTELPEEP